MLDETRAGSPLGGSLASFAFWLAQEETAADWGAGAKNVIFICVFLLALIAAAIWWLRRG